MGLTIHYSLRSTTRSVNEARCLTEQLRQHALDLPFKEVGSLIELKGVLCDFNRQPQDDPNRWLLVQATEGVARDRFHYSVAPSHVVAFSTWPGDGCEPANFGLARYPSSITTAEGRRIRTGLTGWCWASFCKTQYSSDPACGGVANFLRCHLSVVRLLDLARDLGILQHVSDEGDYWQKRDVKALAEEVGEWNEIIAAGAGRLKDLLGEGVQSQITADPDFEHLEARGNTKMEAT